MTPNNIGVQKYTDCPDYLREFLQYMLTIKGRSPNTVDGYYIDLRTYLRFIKAYRGGLSYETFSEITVADVNLAQLKTMTLSDIYAYLHFVMTELQNADKARARKVSALKSFYRYMTVKVGLLEENPVKELEVPALKKTLPKYLTLDESLDLLGDVESRAEERDFCMLTLFLNCGMRLSELIGINMNDLTENRLRLLGKGNKERIIYLNQACLDAIAQWIKVRPKDTTEKTALFISRNGRRISKRRVQQIVEENLRKHGLSGFSTHKLRHTAATLLYQYGHVDIRILKELLGHANLATTEIYTHISNSQLEQAAQQSPLNHKNKK